MSVSINRRDFMILPAALLLGARFVRSAENPKEYEDAARAFSIKLPPGWNANREPEEMGSKTLISSNDYLSKIFIITGEIPEAARGAHLPEDWRKKMKEEQLAIGKNFLEGWVHVMKKQFEVKTEKIVRVKYGQHDALRMDVMYNRGDKDDPRKGFGIYIHAEKQWLFWTVTFPVKEENQVEAIFKTFAVGPGR